MADGEAQVGFADFLREARQKNKAQQRAQELFGKNRRGSAPPVGPKTHGGSLAERVGISKRTPSLPRSNTPRLTRPSARPNGDPRPRPAYSKSSVDVVSDVKSNGPARQEMGSGGQEMSIRGAASGPFIIRAQNFAPGTTAADIESVMQGIGGEMTGCKLVASSPTVIAEIGFIEKPGAEKVIEMFNGKRADGRPLYVYWKDGRGAPKTSDIPVEPPALAAKPEDEMMIDENAESREAANRQREEARRPLDDRDPRDSLPRGPRMEYDDFARGPTPGYRGGRYRGGFSGGSAGGFGGGFGGGRRGYGFTRQMGGGQSWRP